MIDGGANIGSFSLYLLAHVPGVRIHAYEPSEDTFALLSANARTRASEEWHVHRAALWRECGSVSFEMRDWSTSRRIGDAGGSVSVPAVDLAKVLADAGDGPVELMKVDIEGAEADFLMGKEPLLGRVRHLLLELHTDRLDVAPLVASLGTLYPHAYRISRQGSSKPVVLWTPRGDLDLPPYVL
ncbi:MAG: FkbM family methyltransferase [Magnetospirillum sp.]|nr:FkbM family methyltransferase [Magnetospirillum sp.]